MLKIFLYDEQHKLEFGDKINKLKLPEELILKKSLDWFSDPQPCFIHRSAVMKRLFIQLEDFLIENKEKHIQFESLDDELKEIFGCYSNIVIIEY